MHLKLHAWLIIERKFIENCHGTVYNECQLVSVDLPFMTRLYPAESMPQLCETHSLDPYSAL